MARVDALIKLLERDPDDIELHYMLAMAYKSTGDHPEAMRCFDRCIAMNAQYPPAWFQKANTQIDAQDSAGAKETLTQGILQARAAGDEHAAEEMAAVRDAL